MEQSNLILLVEDEVLIALGMQDALEDAGYAVHHAAHGEEAMAALAEYGPRLSGLVTDIQLGGVTDGWALGRQSRQLKPHLPVVYVSGNSARDHSVKGVTVSIMLQKPLVSAKLVSAISTLIKASSVVPSA